MKNILFGLLVLSQLTGFAFGASITKGPYFDVDSLYQCNFDENIFQSCNTILFTEDTVDPNTPTAFSFEVKNDLVPLGRLSIKYGLAYKVFSEDSLKEYNSDNGVLFLIEEESGNLRSIHNTNYLKKGNYKLLVLSNIFLNSPLHIRLSLALQTYQW